MSVSVNGAVATTEWEHILERGEIAPFSGVLVPEDAYRFYQTDSEVYKGCEERLKASVGFCEPPEEPLFSMRQLMWLGFGAAAGYIYAKEHE